MANYPLSEAFIKQLHYILKSGTSDSRKTWFAVGEYKRFENAILVRMDAQEDIVEQVKKVALTEHITLASVQALGALKEFTVGVYDVANKAYHANSFSGSYEIVSLTGTIDTMIKEIQLVDI